MTDKTNPLAGHFRQPKLYVKLPSGGKFNNKDALDMPENGELAIFPMTAKDELLMKNPDALLNGDAVIQVIQSCVPSVKNAYELMSTDIDALLLAIQAATNGDEIDVNEKCEKCENEISGKTSVQGALDSIEPLQENYVAEIDNLEIVLRPLQYKKTIEAGLVNFQTTRSLQSITEIPDDMDKLKIFNENFTKLAFLNFSLLVDTIYSITIKGEEDVIVTDREQIQEFLDNCESKIGQEITEESKKLSNIAIQKDIPFECEECGHTFTKIMALDPVNFFTPS